MTSRNAGASGVASGEQLDGDFAARLRSWLADDRLGAAARLFRLQIPVRRDAAAEELGETGIDALVAARLAEADARTVRPLAALSIYGHLLIASDLRARADEHDYVLGVGPASQTLARLTIRRPVSSVLDLGTGSGVQALLAAVHAERVIGVDVNERALAFAERNAVLNDVRNVEWTAGDWLEPVAGERFGLVVASPPYVVSPDRAFAFRDSGEAGDMLVRRLLRAVADVLDDGGFAQVQCDWVPREGDWRLPLEESVAGRGCDAVLLKYGETEPGTYAAGWNRRLAVADRRAFAEAVDRWTAHYRASGIESIAFGMVVLRRRTEGPNWIRAFVVPARATEAAGEHVVRLFEGWDWVRGATHDVVLDTAFAAAPGARLVERHEAEGGSFEPGRVTLEVRPNVGFAARVDPDVARVVFRFDGRRSLRELLANEPDPVRHALPAEVARLVGLGLLTLPNGGRKIDRSRTVAS